MWIVYFLGGILISFVVGTAVTQLLKNRIGYSEASARARAMLGRLFSEEELADLRDSSLAPKVQKSKYWGLVQLSSDRMDFEERMEELMKEIEGKMEFISPSDSKKFVRAVHMRHEIRDIKFVLAALEKERSLEGISSLSPTKSEVLEELFGAKHIGEAIGTLREFKLGKYISFSLYHEHGLTGLEYALDRYHFKEMKKAAAARKELMDYYDIIRNSYVARNILYLKKKGHDSRAIISMLGLGNDLHIEMAEEDFNILLRRITSEVPELEKKLLVGEPLDEILEDSLEREKLRKISILKLEDPLGAGPLLEANERIARELQMAKDIWWYR